MITRTNALQHMLAHLQAHPEDTFTLHVSLAPKREYLAAFCDRHHLRLTDQIGGYTIKIAPAATAAGAFADAPNPA